MSTQTVDRIYVAGKATVNRDVNSDRIYVARKTTVNRNFHSDS